MAIILHCGAQKVGREQLNNPVLPQTTDSYQPIGHDYFVDLVEHELGGRGFEVVDEVHGLSNDGANYFGVFKVDHADLKPLDYALMVGMRNSHAKKFAAGIAAGANVFICDNLSFSGEIKAGRKHTNSKETDGGILYDLPVIIAQSISAMMGLVDLQNRRFEAYKERELKVYEAEHVMVEMLRRGIMNAHRLPKLVQQWDAPDHDEFTRTGRSAWRMFNAATEALKGTNAIDLARKTEKLHQLTDDVVDLAA